jgi:hypothetical protein
MESPWEIHQTWMDNNNLYGNQKFIMSYFILYRNWLYELLNKKYPTIRELKERINF